MTELKIITYNTDGLPEKLDLNNLPWLLKPIAWIYKIFKKTTFLTINDNQDKSSKTEKISELLNDSDADVICIQEDFNYHEELTSCLQNYNQGTFMGGFDLSKIFSKIRWLPYPRYKSDGLNIFTKHSILKEEIVRWTHSCGYFTHANDKLSTKGFRRYVIKKDDVYLDVYIVHMDADFYNPVKCPDVSGDIKARKKQVEQLKRYIATHLTTNPIIIIGDTNCRDDLGWQEIVAGDYNDVDRVFYINNSSSLYKISPAACRYCFEYSELSDHLPLEVKFEIVKREEL